MKKKTEERKVSDDKRLSCGYVVLAALIVLSVLVVVGVSIWLIADEVKLHKRTKEQYIAVTEESGNLAYGAQAGEIAEGILEQDATGEKITVGEQGSAGEKGAGDNRDAAGEKGAGDDRGATGEKGEAGERGSKGETGEQGPKGDTGERGDKGDKGDRGRDGKDVSEELKQIDEKLKGRCDEIDEKTIKNKEQCEELDGKLQGIGQRLDVTADITESNAEILAGLHEEMAGIVSAVGALTKKYDIPEEKYEGFSGQLAEVMGKLEIIRNFLGVCGQSEDDELLRLNGEECIIVLSGETNVLLEKLEALCNSSAEMDGKEKDVLISQLSEVIDNYINSLTLAEQSLDIMGQMTGENIPKPDIGATFATLRSLQDEIATYRVNDYITGSFFNIKMSEVYGRIATVTEQTKRLEDRLGGISFGYDSESGKYGYIDQSGQFSPFRKPAGTAMEEEVLAGITFANEDSDRLTGKMKNNAGLKMNAEATIKYEKASDNEEDENKDIDRVVVETKVPENGYYTNTSVISADITEAYKRGREDYIEKLQQENGDPEMHLIVLNDSGQLIKASASISSIGTHCVAADTVFNPGYRTLICIRGKVSAGCTSDSVTVTRYENATKAFLDSNGKKVSKTVIAYKDAERKKDYSLCVCDISEWEYLRLNKTSTFNYAEVSSASIEEFFVFTTLSEAKVLEKIDDYYQNW